MLNIDVKKFSLIYSKILDHKFTIKLINFGTLALMLDYYLSLIKLAWPNIQQYLYNPLLWKMENNGEHHVIDIVAILGMYFIFAWRFHKLDIRMWGLFALYFWYVFISYHEIAWWLSYPLSYYIFGVHAIPQVVYLPTWIEYTSALWIPDGFMVISFLIFYKILKTKNLTKSVNLRYELPYKYFIFLASIYAIWILFQFPLTVDYYGHTVYYLSNIINFWEIFVWVSTIYVALKTFHPYKGSLSTSVDAKGQSNLTRNTYLATITDTRSEQ